MVSIVDRYSLPDHLDKRFKLTEKDRTLIKKLYFESRLSIHGIARLYAKVCSKRTIQYVLFPERKEKVKQRAKEVKRWTKYNKKELHTPAIRKHRAYKRELLAKGLL